ncbi:MAG: arylsulfatase [Halobacteriaceae archaeon]
MSDSDSDPDSGHDRPNVLVFICDDLGYGDLACHGNTVVETPTLDGLHGESARLTRFYGGPVCSPARASLMTGRWHYRTGVTDTYKGRSMMAGDEVTMAERLADAGYRTGLFGKWHLGDNYPMRPHDQGFEEALYHQGGGLCQPAGEPDETYFDPLLWRNGDPERGDGFCTDAYTDAAVEFVEDHAGDEPFFTYVASNAPHTPLQCPDEYAEPYLDAGCSEERARFYGMVSNIDDNVGRLLDALERTGQAEDTVVVFTSDHGPALHQDEAGRYRAGLRDGKGSVYEGGVRVPCFVRWPDAVEPRDCDQLAHFVDLFPTLLPACGADLPTDRTVDGADLRAVLREGERIDDRRVFLQWHRGDEPDLYRNCAVVEDRFKLVNGDELYDLAADPGEHRNVAADHPEVVTRLREAYEEWFADVSGTRGYEPPRIAVGTDHENPTRLTRQEAQCARDGGGWTADDAIYYWELDAAEGSYDVTVDFRSREVDGARARVRFGDDEATAPVTGWQSTCTFEGVDPGAGEARLEAWVETDHDRFGVRYATVERTD